MGLADDIIRLAQKGADDAALIAARQVAQRAIENMPIGDPELDPDQETALRESVRIEPSIQGGYHVIVDTPYAARQEFNQRLQHPRGGGSRYLQRALHDVAAKFPQMVAGKVDAETSTGRISDPSRSHRRRRSAS